MPPTPPPRRPASPPAGRLPARVLVVLAAVAAVTGCAAPPELRQPVSAGTPSTPPPPTSAPASPVPSVTGLPSAVPGVTSPSTDPGFVATPCRNGPAGQRVVQLLRGPSAVLPDSVGVRVRTGPLCAGDWQYTVLDVTGHEELQVVTRGRSSAPELVTAGTDVCTAEVRAVSPPGIRTLACDGGTVAPPGA
ncbi:hypothetical protein [Micromonospora sp. URMC 103]|uniref:hypothetical protein n=1 Tax=Micromonospora sp. URMC 103 TaxID=3423406 RepID=UPI003F19F1BC